LISDGCAIGEGAVIENSVIGLRCQIGKNVTIRNSVIMGADYFVSSEDQAADAAAGRPAVGIGDGSHIEGAIVDKNCRIGRKVRIAPQGIDRLPDGSPVVIEDRVIVVPKETTLADGWVLKS
jgi:glucose-1-phosphate adenylyltransferase